MKSEKDASVSSRKKLAEMTKQFRRLAGEPEKAAAAGPLLKAYQEEIDQLTRRAKFSEQAFFQLYKGLFAAPDPAPALALVVANAESDQVVDENRRLQQELKDYEAEFVTLKNQDITIRKLQEQVATGAREQEETIHQQVQQRTREVDEQLEKAALEWAQQRQDYERQLEASRAELREAFARLDAMQSEFFAHKQRAGLARNALDAEMETISQESLVLQTLQLEKAQLKQQLDELLRSSNTLEMHDERFLAPSSADTEGGETVRSATKMQAEHDAVITALRQEVICVKESNAVEIAAATEELKKLNSALENAQRVRKDLEAQLAARPTIEKFHEVTRKLHVLQQLEYNIVDDDDERSKTSYVDTVEDHEAAGGLEAATVEVEKILVSRVRRLEHSLQECERLLQARTLSLQKAQGDLHDRDATIREQSTLIRNLEENVSALEKDGRNRGARVIGGDIGSEILLDAMEDQFTLTSTPAYGNKATAVATDVATVDSDNKILEIVRSQRDRFRERMKELQSEKNRVEELALSYKSSVARLETDNMQLYHKIRYLQTYSGDSKLAGSRNPRFSTLEDGASGISDVEARYRGMYEAKMNPFVQFNKMEKQQRFTNLNSVDKILLTSAKLLLGHRITRNMAFGYILMLHFLVLATLYSYMHICNVTNAS